MNLEHAIDLTAPRLHVGDLVEAVRPFQLVSGSGAYRFAVVVCDEPLTLISEAGDMMWTATLYPGCVRTVGKASEESLHQALARFESERERFTKKKLGYELSRPDAGGGTWMFCGTTVEQVLRVLQSELESDFEEGAEQSTLLLRPIQISEEEIEAMPEFPGW